MLITAVMIASSSGCTIAQPPQELNAQAFNKHYANEEQCSAFISSLVMPAAHHLADLHSVQGMRSWLAHHPGDAFADIVTRVQSMTAANGVMDPQSEVDQIGLTKALYTVLKNIPNFARSGCGPDVRETMMIALYNGIGGGHAAVIKDLMKHGVSGAYDQQWVLLTAVLSPKLPLEWVKEGINGSGSLPDRP